MSRSSSTRWFTAAVAGVAMTLALGLQAGVVPATVATALPAGPTDESKVPHYFGPWPNWANSPLTLSKAQVTINGTGTGATAVAQVDPATGGIKSIDVTSPGHD